MTEKPQARERRCGLSLVSWFEKNARDLPWRRGYDPYHVLVSEFMLQQTQIKTVLPYFDRWVARWPSLDSLSRAGEPEALKLWEGLGYYSRCRNLLKCAKAMRADGHEAPPPSVEALRSYPGIGPYTAGAVASLAYNLPVPAVDGNAERVISRVCDLTETGTALRRRVGEFVVRVLKVLPGAPRAFNQGLMDLGSLVCSPTSPLCGDCPLSDLCLSLERGLTSQRPVPVPRREVQRSEAWGLLCLLEGKGKFLLRRRPEKGLWASMWELPWIERGDGGFEADFRDWAAPLGLERLSCRMVGEASFSFTHHRVRARVVFCEVRMQSPYALPGEGWGVFQLDELATLTLPAPSRKFLKAYHLWCKVSPFRRTGDRQKTNYP